MRNYQPEFDPEKPIFGGTKVQATMKKPKAIDEWERFPCSRVPVFLCFITIMQEANLPVGMCRILTGVGSENGSASAHALSGWSGRDPWPNVYTIQERILPG